MDVQEVETPKVRRLKKRRIFGAVFLLLILLLAVAWWQRYRLADNLVRDQIASRDIKASYQIDEIGLRTQRLRNVVLGDPANPDLTAKVVEVDIIIGFGTPTIRAVRASGVRIRGQYIGDKLSFGELDKFMDPTSKEPFAFPDFSLKLDDALLSLSTPYGGIGAALNGSGHLRNRFDGQLVVRSPKLDGGGCAATLSRFDGAIRIRNSQPELDGPLAAARLDCKAQGIALSGPALKGKVKLSTTFDNWVGDFGFAANSARLSGAQLNAPAGKLSFFGDKKRTEFDLALVKAGYRGGSLSVAKLSGGANGTIGFGENGLALSARGDAQIGGGSVPASMLTGISGIARGTKATPVGPIMAALEPALRNALRSFDGQLGFDFASAPGGASNLTVNGLSLSAVSGARIVQSGPLIVSQGKVTGPVSLSLSGGGLPKADVALRQQGRGWAGTLALAPYAAGGASISLPNLAFTGGLSGLWRFNGQATLTGPLMGGKIEGLSLPVEGSYDGNRFAMLAGCRDVRFTRFQTGALNLPATSFQACAQNGPILQVAGGETRLVFTSPKVAARGSLGSTPLAFEGGNVRFDMDSGFSASNVSVDLGPPDALTQFNMASLGGRFTGGNGLSGTLEGGAGQIANVPLLIEAANGNWGWNNSVLTLEGMAQVSDAEQVDRFKTMNVPSMQIALENSIITAIGYLAEPKTGIRVADVDIRHELNSSTGRALLAVDNLTFGDLLQPSDLTPLTVGSIANAEGSVSGDGVIQWNSSGVTSRGKFDTQDLDFAAAFGPVTGLSTELNFTDLLGMETAPGQVARIKVVNPGVPAFDGRLEYRLLPDQKVQIEGGRWPFYGGELILEPTVLDFDVSAKRELTFRLVGLDAEKFLAGYDLENLRVSGVFDGTLPMVFDAEGGRIVGGWLVSRPGGGEVSYLGQLSYEEMGTFANFAFEALRSIKFDEMQIGVEGNIAGEVVTQVRFRGLQQGSGAKRNFITKQLAKLPLEFNVRIEAEFLTLIGSLRALYDAEYAAERYKGYFDTPTVVAGKEQPQP
ncbi:MAG: YdbH domain-containing protein [Sphingorhabdus sp.]